MKFLTLSVIFAVVGATLGANLAQAETIEFLSTFPNTFKSASTKPELGNLGSSLALACASSSGTGEVAAQKGGSFNDVFKSCKATINKISVGECKGLAETVAGQITITGTFVLSVRPSTLTPLINQSFNAVHIECPGTLIVVSGRLCGLTTLAKGTSATWTFAQGGAAGDQSITRFGARETSAEAECELLSAINEGTMTMSALVQTQTLTFAKEIEVDD